MLTAAEPLLLRGGEFRQVGVVQGAGIVGVALLVALGAGWVALDRRNESARVAVEAGAETVERVAARGETRLERLVSLVLLGDLVSLYLAVLRGEIAAFSPDSREVAIAGEHTGLAQSLSGAVASGYRAAAALDRVVQA